MRLELLYGRGNIALTIPDDRVAGVYAPRPAAAVAGDAMAAALAQPRGLPRLAELCRGKRVTLLIGDKTRSTPRFAAGRALLDQLAAATAVQLFITSGSHDANEVEDREVLEQLTEHAAAHGIRCRTHIHDCWRDVLHNCGTTTRGTPVQLNAAALNADLFVIHSDLKPHYFAGYSNAGKHLMPGLSGYAGIERNHALALDPAARFGHHPWHSDPRRRRNPLAEDLAEAYTLAIDGRPVFVLATISQHDRVQWAEAGAAAAVMPAGFAELDRSALHTVTPARYAVISCGGYPLDETLYTAHAGLEMVRSAIMPGGEALLLAECADGLAPNESAVRNFYEPLRQPLADLAGVTAKQYKLGAHKVVRLAQFMVRNTLHLTSGLPADVVSAIHILPAPDPQAVIDRWLARHGSIAVFRQANKIAVLSA